MDGIVNSNVIKTALITITAALRFPRSLVSTYTLDRYNNIIIIREIIKLLQRRSLRPMRPIELCAFKTDNEMILISAKRTPVIL